MRKTIGVLLGTSILDGTLVNRYVVTLINSIKTTAKKLDIDLLISSGIRGQKILAWPEVTKTSDYIPVGPYNTDGLIVLSPLSNSKQSEYIQNLRKNGFPVLFIATGEDGPSIAVNNQFGIIEAIKHLKDHGHRSIAMIAGLKTDKGDSLIRLETYKKAVNDFKLVKNPQLIKWGWHTDNGGYNAMQELLDSNINFSAVLASDDASAIGAMRAIKEVGLKIPRDIAIVGFNGTDEGASQIPALTSIINPIELIGEQAVVMMKNYLVNGSELHSVLIKPELKARNSCGCISKTIINSAKGPENNKNIEKNNQNQIKVDEIINDMITVLPSSVQIEDKNLIKKVLIKIIQSIKNEIIFNEGKEFENELLNSITEFEFISISADYWQSMINILRKRLPDLFINWSDESIRYRTENLIHQLRTTFTHFSENLQKHNRFTENNQARLMNEINAKLSAALDEVEIDKILKQYNHKLGINEVDIFLFVNDKNNPFQECRIINKEKINSFNFKTKTFPPRKIYNKTLSLLLFPLIFNNINLGFVSYNSDNIEVCASLTNQIALSLHMYLMHKKIVDISMKDSLTGLNNRRYFELALNKEVLRFQRYNRPMTLIVLDIDNFKSYNDTFGHLYGDLAIKTVSKNLKQNIRHSDILARIGGDEFVILLSETTKEGAIELVARISKTMQSEKDLMRKNYIKFWYYHIIMFKYNYRRII